VANRRVAAPVAVPCGPMAMLSVSHYSLPVMRALSKASSIEASDRTTESESRALRVHLLYANRPRRRCPFAPVDF
jgi:hypothetical protein